MPLYQYHCSKCESDFEQIKPIADRFWTEECPECSADSEFVALVINSAPTLVAGVGTHYSRTSDGFRDNLERIKKHHPRNTIKT
jgi:putative FmdB family regulatory protein